MIATEKQDPHGKFKRVKKVMLHEFKRLNQNQKGGVFKKPGFRAQNRCR